MNNSITNFGDFLPSIRYNTESGELTCSVSNQFFEREQHPIPLNTSASTFVIDMLTREHGRGHIEVGTYKMYLAPVSQPIPPVPAGEDPKNFKAALAMNMWNPTCGLARLEATSQYLKAAIRLIWNEYSTSKEGAEGLMPVVRFTGTKTVTPPKYPNKRYLAPIIERVGFMPREAVPEFAAMEPTNPLPVYVENNSQLVSALRAKLEAPKAKKTGKPDKLTDSEDLNDPIGDL
jgi:hypothetical protein